MQAHRTVIRSKSSHVLVRLSGSSDKPSDTNSSTANNRPVFPRPALKNNDRTKSSSSNSKLQQKFDTVSLVSQNLQGLGNEQVQYFGEIRDTSMSEYDPLSKDGNSSIFCSEEASL